MPWRTIEYALLRAKSIRWISASSTAATSFSSEKSGRGGERYIQGLLIDQETFIRDTIDTPFMGNGAFRHFPPDRCPR